MLKLAAYAAIEVPRVNAALQKAIAELHPEVRSVASHVLDAGGKRLRPLLTLLVGGCLGKKGDELMRVACAIEILHSATLLHDDIVDAAPLRRGRPTAHALFGSTRTILAGDALLALANSMVARLGQPRLVDCLSEAVMQTATGEILEIANLRRAGLGRDTYIEIIAGKTAYLLKASCQAAAILADAGEDMERAASDFGFHCGIAFQLVDDAIDYSSSPDAMGKEEGGDLREGKMTLPLTFYLESLAGAEREAFVRGFEQGTFSQDDERRIRKAILDGGFAGRTRDEASAYIDLAAKALFKLPDTKERALLDDARGRILSRDR